MARLLLVDDDPEQLGLHKLLLAAKGHDVFTATDVATALRLVAELRPDTVITDLRLPALADGLRFIREAPEGPRIVVLTGWPLDLKDRPEGARIAETLMKPVRLGVLLRVIGAALLLALAAVAQSFDLQEPAEVVAELEMSAARDWEVVDLSLNGRRSHQLMLWAGRDRQVYATFLGELPPGRHQLRVEGGRLHATRFRAVPRSDALWPVVAHAPILYARRDTVGRFTDVPLLVYAERLGAMLQYTVIFSNEDGGTATGPLMARWGRTTDIEYVYRVWPETGRATIQSRDHKEIPYRGRREGLHPRLIPVTQNNMVAPARPSPVRYQIAPLLVDLNGHSREQVMDANPATYRVMAQELEREGKALDPRRYLFIEARAENRHGALAVWVRLRGEHVWRSSHRGRPDWAIDRDGWFRTAIELPRDTSPDAVEELAFECLLRPARPQPESGVCRLEAVSKAFFLGPDYLPRPSFFSIGGPLEIATGEKQVVLRK